MLALVAALWLVGRPARAADDIGDISVSAAAIYTGDTAHGYAEARVVLENNSSKTHNVTLTSPNRSFGDGNNLSRLARTVTLAPGVTVVVSLLQPPLPSNGDGMIRVSVDGREEGATRLPNANNHCVFYGRGSGMAATAFLSRSVDADLTDQVLNQRRGANAASQATRRPALGLPEKFWMPDTRALGRTNWLELEYDRPVSPYALVVHSAQSPVTTGFIDLIGVTGTNLARLNLAAGAVSPSIGGPSGSNWEQVFSFSPPPEPIKTVRLNFGTAPPGNIAIEAVSLEDAHGHHFAATARASSENNFTTASTRSPAYPMYPGRGFVRGDPNAIQCLRAESALADWSDNWLAYTPFDVVVLGAGDLAAMPAPVAEAIGDYLQAGGNVVIAGANSLPAAWNPIAATVREEPGLITAEAGFGHVFALADANPSDLDFPATRAVHEAVLSTANYWSALPYDSGAANAALPVVQSIKIPVRGITVVMLAFIILVGPVNFFLLARKNKRIWMLWTIPAISLVTTLLIFAYSLLREGITPNTRIAGLTLLDQAGHHAVTYGAIGFYCPLTPSDGLRFDNETEATPLVPINPYQGSSREVDWTQTQHFQRGWVTSRVPAHFHVRKSEVRRERLAWQKVNGGWQVINGLGAPIKSLWLADPDMNYYHAENLPAGQPATLAPVKETPSIMRQGPGALFRDRGYTAASAGDGDAALAYLQPGTYIAELDGNPFIENALGAAASPKRTQSAAVVYGILDPPANP
jgi:hypothetical protein